MSDDQNNQNAMHELKTPEPTESVVRSMPLLECGHPGLPNNLKDGKCGTCQCAAEWDELAKETKDVDLKALTLKIANCFRSGSMVYDTNGKTLMEIEEASRPHSNGEL